MRAQRQVRRLMEVTTMSSHEERLTEFGIPVDAVKGVVLEQLGAVQAVQNSTVGRWVQQNDAQIASYLQRHPDVAGAVGRMMSADAGGAVEFLAMKMAQESGRAPARSGLEGRSGLLPMPGEPFVSDPATSPPADELAAAFEDFQRTGSRRAAERYAHARLRTVVSDEHLNS